MATRSDIAQAAAKGLRQFAKNRQNFPVLVGFDGFVDSIITVVDKRVDAKHFEPVKTIAHLSQKIAGAAGMSSNYELVVNLQKLGGNGPIMANALSTMGLAVTYIGALGVPSVHPVFDDFAKTARVLSISDPGFTDALEFEDGKLMLGKHQALRDVNWDNLIARIGKENLIDLVNKSRFIGNVNWTMLTALSEVWAKLISDILPKVGALPAVGNQKAPRRRIFVDLADPEKRTAQDVLHALNLVTGFEKFCDTTLGLNLKESSQVAEVLGIAIKGDHEAAIESTALSIREKLNINTVVIHPRKGAAAAELQNGKVTSATFAGPFIAAPKLSTGAGDNFNAGFSVGQLANLPVDQALATGTGTSGFYVRNAGSPTLEQLADFCDNLPAPQ